MGLPSTADAATEPDAAWSRKPAGAKVTATRAPGSPAPYLLIGFDTPAGGVGDDEPPAIVVVEFSAAQAAQNSFWVLLRGPIKRAASPSDAIRYCGRSDFGQ